MAENVFAKILQRLFAGPLSPFLQGSAEVDSGAEGTHAGVQRLEKEPARRVSVARTCPPDREWPGEQRQGPICVDVRQRGQNQGASGHFLRGGAVYSQHALARRKENLPGGRPLDEGGWLNR